MSKKSIVFNIPSVDGHPDVEILVEPSRPNPRAGRTEANAVARASTGADSVSGRFAIDIARERELGDVVTLALALPAMLVWFWWANAVERYSRILG